MTDSLSRAHQLLASGQLDEARIYLEELLRQDPENTDLLYNLGLCYVDLGQLRPWHRSAAPLPADSTAALPRLRVALGIAYLKKGDLSQAKKFTMQALAADPRNPLALKNLGAILGKECDLLQSPRYIGR